MTGIVIGVVVSVVAARALAPLLFATSPYDPLVFVVVPLVMMATAFLAAFVPAVRARRIDPIEAMRAE